MTDMLVQELNQIIERSMKVYTNIKLSCCLLYVFRYVNPLSYRGMKAHLVTKERLELPFNYLILIKLVSAFKAYFFYLFILCFTLTFDHPDLFN